MFIDKLIKKCQNQYVLFITKNKLLTYENIINMLNIDLTQNNLFDNTNILKELLNFEQDNQ
jgi:hypothetical protein